MWIYIGRSECGDLFYNDRLERTICVHADGSAHVID